MVESKLNRPVVVTGMGIVSPFGLTLDALWNACQNSVNAVIPREPELHLPDDIVPLRYWAPASHFTGTTDDFGTLSPDLKKEVRKSLKLMAREIQMGVAAAQRAFHHAGILPDTIPPERGGVSFASDYIVTTPEEVVSGIATCAETGTFDFSRWGTEGLPKMAPIWQLKYLPNMPTSHLSILNRLYGAASAITNGEASVGGAVADAVGMLQRGYVDMVVVGATGSRIQPFKQMSARLNQSLAASDLPPEEASRPFDRHRTGMVLGEGAGAVILESAEHAIRRGATIHAEILGGCSRAVVRKTVGGDIASEDGEVLAESIERTLTSLFAMTGVTPNQVGHINAHGLATPTADSAEATAIRRVFQDHADTVPVTGLKGHYGNPGAGGGVIELIASILAMQQNALFPLKNNQTDDPACPIRPVRDFGEPSGDIFLKIASNSFGQSSALLVRRYE